MTTGITQREAESKVAEIYEQFSLAEFGTLRYEQYMEVAKTNLSLLYPLSNNKLKVSL